MLRVIDKGAVQNISIEYDLYIPINIKFGIWNVLLEPTIYWRTGDLKKSLIEIGFGKIKNEIRSITLVICDKVCEAGEIHTKIKTL